MVANSTEYQREYMRTYYARHGNRINRNRVLNKVRQTGRIPKASTITKYDITDEELMSLLHERFQASEETRQSSSAAQRGGPSSSNESQ